jgi:hypothetical protein
LFTAGSNKGPATVNTDWFPNPDGTLHGGRMRRPKLGLPRWQGPSLSTGYKACARCPAAVYAPAATSPSTPRRTSQLHCQSSCRKVAERKSEASRRMAVQRFHVLLKAGPAPAANRVATPGRSKVRMAAAHLNEARPMPDWVVCIRHRIPLSLGYVCT